MEFAFSMLRVACPIMYASLGGLFSERAGVINIALEGFMLVGAFSGAVITLYTGNAYLGFFGAAFIGSVFAVLYAAAVIHGKANQVVAGTAMNLLAMGMIPIFLKALFDSAGGSPAIPMENRFVYFPLLFVWILGGVIWWIFQNSAIGLWFSFAGENPKALEAAGISVNRVRYSAVALSGALAGLGGATLSLCLSSSYSNNMVAGRGFMALAALILGKWKPSYALLACLFFGAMEALQFRLQSVDLQGAVGIPSQFVVVIPYVATILVLAGFLGGARAPKALGIPH
jgi:general nucleoside transport system permease protein